MWTALKQYTSCLIRRLFCCLFIAAMISVILYLSLFTPIFSSAGLHLLNKLPIPDAHKHQKNFTIKTNFIENPVPHNNSQLILEDIPSAYVVLGGGLTELKPNNNDEYRMPQSSKLEADKAQSQSAIVLNQYSLSRVYTAYINYKHLPLPIVLTGVESPWMSDWLLENNIHNIITENASMNTCENARFTAKRLNLSNVYLITDAYHMTRARRQFALNGIRSTPLVAPLPAKKGWANPKQNLIHSRRTIYELAAYVRDIFIPQKNCRTAEEVSLNTLMKSRKPNSNEAL